jgi:hypothetical protein
VAKRYVSCSHRPKLREESRVASVRHQTAPSESGECSDASRHDPAIPGVKSEDNTPPPLPPRTRHRKFSELSSSSGDIPQPKCTVPTTTIKASPRHLPRKRRRRAIRIASPNEGVPSPPPHKLMGRRGRQTIQSD